MLQCASVFNCVSVEFVLKVHRPCVGTFYRSWFNRLLFIFHLSSFMLPVMFCWQFENGTFAHSFNTNGIIYIHRSFHLNALYTRIYVVFIIYTPDHTAFPFPKSLLTLTVNGGGFLDFWCTLLVHVDRCLLSFFPRCFLALNF